jgi:hypothetical protein
MNAASQYPVQHIKIGTDLYLPAMGIHLAWTGGKGGKVDLCYRKHSSSSGSRLGSFTLTCRKEG